jgi:hypothetical protein
MKVKPALGSKGTFRSRQLKWRRSFSLLVSKRVWLYCVPVPGARCAFFSVNSLVRDRGSGDSATLIERSEESAILDDACGDSSIDGDAGEETYVALPRSFSIHRLRILIWQLIAQPQIPPGLFLVNFRCIWILKYGLIVGLPFFQPPGF